MPAKIIPVVDGKNKTWADIQAIMGGVTRQQAQAKYKKLKELGPVTRAGLQTRYQAPAVAQRKAENLNNITQANMLNHARTHGVTHTSMEYKVSREEIQAMLDSQDKQIKAFYNRTVKK